MTSAILAGLAALVGLATVAWHRYRRRAAEDARDRAMARADRAEADAAGLAETARATADQLARDRAGVRAAEEIRRAPPDPDPVAAVRAVDAAARRVRDSLPPGDGASPPAAVSPGQRRPADD